MDPGDRGLVEWRRLDLEFLAELIVDRGAATELAIHGKSKPANLRDEVLHPRMFLA